MEQQLAAIKPSTSTLYVNLQIVFIVDVIKYLILFQFIFTVNCECANETGDA